MRRIATFLGAIGIALGVTAFLLVQHLGSGHSALAHAGAASKGVADEAALSCGGATLGIAGMIAPGHSAASLRAQGVPILNEVPAAYGGGTFVVLGTTGSSAPAFNGILATTAAVMAQSSSPAFRSCDYKLSDRPAAQRFITLAEQALVTHGTATSAELSADSTLVMVSDDPFHSHGLIVTFDIATPAAPGPAAPQGAPPLSGQKSLIVLVSAQTGEVGGVGEGNW